MLKRKDKIKNTAKVVKAVLKDPLATQDEIVKKTGLSKGTVNSNIKNIDQSGLLSESIDKICNNDKDIMDLVSGIGVTKIKRIKKKLEEEDKDKREDITIKDLKDLSDVAEKSTRRYTLFKGNATDDEGGLKDIASILSEIQGINE